MNLYLNQSSPSSQIEISAEFNLIDQLNITAYTAKRRVTKLLLDEVGNLLYGEDPDLEISPRPLWRVPIWLATPSFGPVAQIGTLDVDAQSGEILYNQTDLEKLANDGYKLAM